MISRAGWMCRSGSLCWSHWSFFALFFFLLNTLWLWSLFRLWWVGGLRFRPQLFFGLLSVDESIEFGYLLPLWLLALFSWHLMGMICGAFSEDESIIFGVLLHFWLYVIFMTFGWNDMRCIFLWCVKMGALAMAYMCPARCVRALACWKPAMCGNAASEVVGE